MRVGKERGKEKQRVLKSSYNSFLFFFYKIYLGLGHSDIRNSENEKRNTSILLSGRQQEIT
jgi:hypothetical protein